MISNEHSKTIQPVLYGLVLAGGKSLRMGQDKGVIKWHGKDQRYYMADMLQNICEEVFISCRPEQKHEIDPGYKIIADTVPGSGPIVAILSAFKEYPEAAWLVTACDLPLLDMDTLRFLLNNRDTSSIATTFESPFDNLPEPLITIWEPASYDLLASHLSDGFSCPRKALIRNSMHVKIIKAPNPGSLMNANTPEDAQNVNEIISMKNL